MAPQGFYTWSQIANNNASADASINWAEGQPPSSINDSARAMMARLAEHRDDWQASKTAGGTATAYTFASNQGFPSLAAMDGQMVTFRPTTTNGPGVTLSVDSLLAQPVVTDAAGTPVPAGSMIAGTPYMFTYYAAVNAFRVWNFFVNPYNIPLAGGMDYWGTTPPNSNFAFPVGQAISRATYSALYALIGNTYGAGDGSTTFNLPNKSGRVSAALDLVGNVLNGSTISPNGATLGAAGGAQLHQLSLAELPTGIASNGSASVSVTFGGRSIATYSTPQVVPVASTGGFASVYDQSGAGAIAFLSSAPGSGTASTASNNTGGGAHAIVQPTIMCNYIMRII